MEVQGINISDPGNCRYDSSDEPFALAMFFIQCPLLALGVFGNLLVLIVVSSYRGASSGINELIRALALFDMCYSGCVAMFAFYYEYYYIKVNVDYATVGRLVVIFVPLSYTCQTLSYWTVAAIAVNRYVAVCRPTKSLTRNTARRARVALAAMTAAAIAYSTPSYVEHWAWKATTDLCHGYVVYVNNILIKSPIYSYGYGLAASVVADYVGPFCVTAYCGFHITVTLVKSRREAFLISHMGRVRNACIRRQIAERRLSVVMLLTSVVFMVCVWADAVDKVLWRVQSSLAPKFYLVQTVFSLTNASSDFFIYAIGNRKFRETLRNLGRCRRDGLGSDIVLSRLRSVNDDRVGSVGSKSAVSKRYAIRQVSVLSSTASDNIGTP